MCVFFSSSYKPSVAYWANIRHDQFDLSTIERIRPFRVHWRLIYIETEQHWLRACKCMPPFQSVMPSHATLFYFYEFAFNFIFFTFHVRHILYTYIIYMFVYKTKSSSLRRFVATKSFSVTHIIFYSLFLIFAALFAAVCCATRFYFEKIKWKV